MATAALAELVGDVVVPGGDAPATTASRTVGGWRLEGTKACVPAGLVADLVLVPATVVSSDGEPGGLGVFLVDDLGQGADPDPPGRGGSTRGPSGAVGGRGR